MYFLKPTFFPSSVELRKRIHWRKKTPLKKPTHPFLT
nr:MAG TPA: hypothetical protein [Caudoviricetes sp.]